MPDGLTRRNRGRILLTTDAVGGVWRYTLDLARGMAARGLSPAIAVLGPAPDPAQRREASGIDLIETGLALDWTAETAGELAGTVAALRSLANGAGSVHLHAPALAGQARWSVPVVAVAHSCTATWWRAVRGGPLPADFAWRADATAAGLHVADAVIAPTLAHAEAVRAVYGDVAIAVVHNGAAPPQGQSRKRPLPLAGEGWVRVRTTSPEPSILLHEPPSLSRGKREQAVLSAGRLWDEGKNVAALDRVAPRLGAPIYAAGPTAGPNGTTIGLPHLHLLGSLSPASMHAAYARYTVFASPARYEPFGLSVLEAALAGMRLVLWDTPGFRELWDGVARFVADEDALLQALRDALAGGTDAQARAQRYTLDAMVDGTLDIHRRVGATV